MAVLKYSKIPSHTLICMDGEGYHFGHHLWYIAAQKLHEKKVRVPKGAVKIRFDQPTGQYQIIFMEPGDLGV